MSRIVSTSRGGFHACISRRRREPSRDESGLPFLCGEEEEGIRHFRESSSTRIYSSDPTALPPPIQHLPRHLSLLCNMIHKNCTSLAKLRTWAHGCTQWSSFASSSIGDWSHMTLSWVWDQRTCNTMFFRSCGGRTHLFWAVFMDGDTHPGLGFAA